MDLCKTIKRNLYCIYRLELLAANVLSWYATKLENEYARIVISKIAIESKKHAEYLELIGVSLNLFEETNCVDLVGEVWMKLLSIQEDIAKGTKLNLREFIERQMWVEKAVGEETYNKLILPLIGDEYSNVCGLQHRVLEVVADILNKIVREENEHEELLNKLLSEETKQT